MICGSASTVCVRSPPLPGSVGVVQQQDRPRLQARDAASDDPLDARQRGVPDAGRPADHPVTEPLGHGGQKRAAEAVRRAEQRRRRLPDRLDHRLLGRAQLVGDRLRPVERHDRVVLAVAGQLVALVDDPAGDLRVRADVAAEHEERGLRAAVAQRVEDGRRVEVARPVVERDGRLRAGELPAGDHGAEQRRVGRERAPGDGEQRDQRDREDRVAQLVAHLDRHRAPDQAPDDREGYEASDDLALAHAGRRPAIRSV